MAKIKVERKTYSVISYCDLPEEIAEAADSSFAHQSNDCFIEYTVTPKAEQGKYSDDFTLDNYLIDQRPELEGRTILIHIDY